MEEHKAQAIQSYLNLGGPLEGICFQAGFVFLFFFFFPFSWKKKHNGRNRKISFVDHGSCSPSLISPLKPYFQLCLVRAAVLLLSLVQPLSCGQISL